MSESDARDNLDMIDKYTKLCLIRDLITDVLQPIFTERKYCLNKETYLSSPVTSDTDSIIKFSWDLDQNPFHFLSRSDTVAARSDSWTAAEALWSSPFSLHFSATPVSTLHWPPYFGEPIFPRITVFFDVLQLAFCNDLSATLIFRCLWGQYSHCVEHQWRYCHLVH